MPEASIRVSRGLYRPPATLALPADRYAALLSVLPAGTVVAGLAAAHVHGFWLPDEMPPSRPDVIIPAYGREPRERSSSVRPEVHARRRRLRPEDWCVVAGLPVTTPVGTWLHLAELLPTHDLVAAGDGVLAGGVRRRRFGMR